MALAQQAGKLWVWSSTGFGYNLKNPVSTGTVLVSFDVNANALFDNTETSERTFDMAIGGESSSNAEYLLCIANFPSTHMYIKHDGSIEDGFEMVTHPISLDYRNIPNRRE